MLVHYMDHQNFILAVSLIKKQSNNLALISIKLG
jgi:hypothetical protein